MATMCRVLGVCARRYYAWLRRGASALSLSMGTVGDCYDNGLCESFFATLECELIERGAFPTRAAAHLSVFDFIEAFYNRKHRHSALGYVSPVAFERATEQARRVTVSLKIALPPRSRSADSAPPARSESGRASDATVGPEPPDAAPFTGPTPQQ